MREKVIVKIEVKKRNFKNKEEIKKFKREKNDERELTIKINEGGQRKIIEADR